MTKELIKVQTITNEKGFCFILEYYLISNDAKKSECFGVGITKTGAGCNECRVIHDLSRDKAQAIRFLDIIWRGKVTPTCLLEIADNFLAREYAYDF